MARAQKKKVTQSSITASDSWRRISAELCAANYFPPGYSIALIVEGKRLRDDIKVFTEGQHSFLYPAAFRVWSFLADFVRDEILPHNPELNFDEIELRNHRGQSVDPNTFLWAIRDQTGERDARALGKAARESSKWKSNRLSAARSIAEEHIETHPAWLSTVRQWEREEEIAEIENLFDDWIESLAEEHTFEDGPDYVVPLAVFERMFIRFDPEFLQFVLERYSDPKKPFRLSSRYRQNKT